MCLLVNMKEDKDKIKCKRCGIDFVPSSDQSAEEELCFICLKLERTSIQPKHHRISDYEGK